MLRAVIVDDEILVINLLKDILKKNQVKTIGEYTQPGKALIDIPGLKPDIIFLDIEMPGMNGIELATELMEKFENANIVFVTAYNQYAIEAFKLNALHYILKPPSMEEIRQAVCRAEKNLVLCKNKKVEKVWIQLSGTVAVLDETGKSLLEWPTQKAEELFALFMILGKKGIDKWSIIEKLWPEYDNSKVEHLLYTTVYRMKKTLEEAGIKATVRNSLGNYTFSIENAVCDIELFEKLFIECKNGAGREEEMERQLFSVYRGALFGSMDYIWGEMYRFDLQKKYEEICDWLIAFYKTKKDWRKVEDIERKIEILEE